MNISSDSAALKYPLLMLHGMGFRDRKCVGYWGRIPSVLEAHGAKVYFGGQDSCGSVEENARRVKTRLEEILAETGTEKVNIFAHSKGGLEARYMISSLGCADKVASLSTFSTPHNGSVTVDKLLKIPDGLVRFGCGITDLLFRILGDESPDVYSAVQSFRTDTAEKFNEENPDAEGVYYQSFGFVMKKCTSDVLMMIPWAVVNHFEGENDGLLAPRAVEWTNFRGVYKGNGRRGISHCDEVDLRRRGFGKRDGGGISDITEFYLGAAVGLKNMGY